MRFSKEKKEPNNWAKNVKEERVYIGNATSGRRGYYCLGCDKEMDAVLFKNPNYQSYFRHVPFDVKKGEKSCPFRDREYRELIATEILHRLKRIKVPEILKYPPKDKGEEGALVLLKEAEFITAHKVKSQLTFYEDKEGNIKWGKNPEIEERHLLIRPDVIFFDRKGKPILFIELVITHKVPDGKKIKLRRIGIDTISIIVPKGSQQEIEDNFKSIQKTKWEYNEIEASTQYIPVPYGHSEGILEFDEIQRRIFGENYWCRKASLNNTIRSIKKGLGSEPYRRAERDIESEISRIENATKEERQRLDSMEREHGGGIERRRQQSIDRIKERNPEGDCELSRGIRKALKVREICENYKERLETYEGYKARLEYARAI